MEPDNSIQLVKKLGKRKDTVEMKDEDLDKLQQHCVTKSKQKGKDQRKWLGLAVLTHTGCRPTEAAYIAANPK